MPYTKLRQFLIKHKPWFDEQLDEYDQLLVNRNNHALLDRKTKKEIIDFLLTCLLAENILEP